MEDEEMGVRLVFSLSSPFIIAGPINKVPSSSVVLPYSLAWDPTGQHFLVGSRQNSSLSAVLAGDDMISPYAVKNLTSESFHADVLSGFYSPWATLSPLPRLCSLEPGRMVFASGRFFCMSCSPFSVLAYDVGSNAWEKIQPPMRRFLRSPSVVAVGDRLLVAAAVEKRKLTVPKSLRVWELQLGGTGGWAEVERMPAEVHRQFDEAEGGRGFETVGSGRSVGSTAGFIALTIKNSVDVIVFDFRQKEWRWAPPCPFVAAAGNGLRGLLTGESGRREEGMVVCGESGPPPRRRRSSLRSPTSPRGSPFGDGDSGGDGFGLVLGEGTFGYFYSILD